MHGPFQELQADRTNFTVHPATIMPTQFTLSRRIAGSPIQYVNEILGNNRYRQHVNLTPDNQIVVESYGPDDIIYNKPHIDTCYAHITLVNDKWTAKSGFHVTVYPAMAGSTAQRLLASCVPAGPFGYGTGKHVP